LEIPSIEVSYSFPGSETATISLEGLRMLAPPVSLDQLFASRARKIRFTRYALIGLAIGVPLTYLLRGSYFVNGWIAGLAIGLGCVAFALDRFMLGWTLGLARSKRWAMVATGIALLACALAAEAEPTLRAARRLLSAGQIDSAKMELIALGHPERPENSQVWADLHLAIANGSDDPEVIRSELEQIPTALPQRVSAARRLYQAVSASARHRLAEGHWERAEAVLANAGPAFRESLGTDTFSAGIAELRALAQDQAFEKCTSEPCRLSAAHRSLSFATNPARSHRLVDSRTNLITSLTFGP
jgi:hypothetical protein